MNLLKWTGIFFVLFFNLVENKVEIVNESYWSENSGSYAAELSNQTEERQHYEYPVLVKDCEEKSSEFPPDLFSEDALRKGAVILHLIGALYSFGVIGIVCGDYFLPSIDCICCDFNLSQDVAAATFMSFATTAPELFIILIATFITKSDIGVGAVVGSGMFNILGVATIGGLAAISPIKLDWWPLYRDSLVYVMAPIALAIVVSDGCVTAVESICLISYYFFYFIIMFFNRSITRNVKACMKEIKNKRKVKKDCTPDEKPHSSVPTISLTLDDSNGNADADKSVLNPQGPNKESKEGEQCIENDEAFKSYFMNYEDSISLRRISASSIGSNRSNRSRKKSFIERKSNVQIEAGNKLAELETKNDNLHFIVPQLPNTFEAKKTEVEVCSTENPQICEDKSEEVLHPQFFTLPEGSFWDKFTWLVLWPASIVLYHTIPDCRSERWRKYYSITFIMCVFWIGIASYFGTWMISVVGETIGIPDSVMGLTFLALGGSMPEAISTFIMARQGEGGLGFSNSLGGNTMDICLCLGLPWLIKCLVEGPVHLKSEGLQYNSIALFVGIVVLLSVATYTKFHMNRRMGVICSIFYLIFLVTSILIELQVIRVEDEEER